MLDITGHTLVDSFLAQTLASTEQFCTDGACVPLLVDCANLIISAIRSGRKLLIIGNGGSAADAQHIAAEFVSRLRYNRSPLPAIALTTDTSIITAIGNDYGFDYVFERQVRALAHPGDVLIGITTSGNSKNVLLALETARSLQLATVAFTGASAPHLDSLTDLTLHAPSNDTAIVQQLHIIAAHIVCMLCEAALRPQQPQ